MRAEVEKDTQPKSPLVNPCMYILSYLHSTAAVMMVRIFVNDYSHVVFLREQTSRFVGGSPNVYAGTHALRLNAGELAVAGAY